MNRADIEDRIRVTEEALRKTKSWKCRNDLRKSLNRLRKELMRTDAKRYDD